MGLGVKHGILAAMIFSAVSALLTAQIQYVAVSVCEEMLRPHNASIDTDSNYIQSSVSSAVMSLNCTHPPHHMRDALSAKTAKAMQLVSSASSTILLLPSLSVLLRFARMPIAMSLPALFFFFVFCYPCNYLRPHGYIYLLIYSVRVHCAAAPQTACCVCRSDS